MKGNLFSLSYKGLPISLVNELDELKEYYNMGLFTFSEWVTQSMLRLQPYYFNGNKWVEEVKG